MHGKCSLAIITLVALAAAAGITPALAAKKMIIGRAIVLDSTGQTAGELRLTGRGTGVELRLTVKGLPAGIHGVHLHAVGSCNAPDFASAGPHLNPHARMHGTLNPQGSHLGDLPNLQVSGSGRGSLIARLTGAQAELWPALFDADGTTIVVHATQDDYRTDPSGNSGDRIACGVIRRS